MLAGKVQIMKELHEIMRDLRQDHDLKQEAVANYLNIKQQAYSNYETGRRTVPSWVIPALAQYYHVSTDYLFGMGHLGNIQLNTDYLGKVTLYDVMYSIQKVNPDRRSELFRYIKYLGGEV